MEVWDLVDENKRLINKLHTRGEAQQPIEYHVVVEILTVNADGQILLTQRDAEKMYPLLWETTGGSVTAGESSIQGAVRELAEETGLVAEEKELEFLGEIRYPNYFLDSYIWKRTAPIQPEDLVLQPGEVCDAKLVTLSEFEDMVQQGLIVSRIWDRFQLNRSRIMPYLNSEKPKGVVG
ncbi:Isopentenyl-diphosphate Delta-isomerase [Planococcus massiliensis]|uniref:Isopentenyl-diphosphate Delta-isomerase n=1 Tax=Planococcus massiliensis TaxID=1499687 RepID=A0A098EKB1_9BACL|nr:NUDIX domain-containing protein [Planococcus massiliensis]CEG22763.1 Isopentenyl-diphosphate Delta-isomerase [Planococcus massiliensis]